METEKEHFVYGCEPEKAFNNVYCNRMFEFLKMLELKFKDRRIIYTYFWR